MPAALPKRLLLPASYAVAFYARVPIPLASSCLVLSLRSHQLVQHACEQRCAVVRGLVAGQQDTLLHDLLCTAGDGWILVGGGWAEAIECEM